MTKKPNHLYDVRYPGELGEPHVRIKPPLRGLFALGNDDPETEKEYQQKNLRILNRKLNLLAAYYEAISDGEIDWKALALSLVFAHVEGFQVIEWPKRKRGRPRQYFSRDDLYRAVLEILDEGESSVVNACRSLTKRKGEWHRANAKTLETRFHEVKRRLVKQQQRTFVDPTSLTSQGYPRLPPKNALGGLFGLGALALSDYKKS